MSSEEQMQGFPGPGAAELTGCSEVNLCHTILPLDFITQDGKWGHFS